MRRIISLIAVLLAAVPAAAIDLGTPKLSESLVVRKFFDSDRLMISSAEKLRVSPGYTLQPHVGLGYVARERSAGVGLDEALHKIQAHAGGKLDLDSRFYLSGGAKVPVYTYGLTDTRTGLFSAQGSSSSHRYDVFHLSSSALLWTGEVGVHLGTGTDLTIYYDQNAFDRFQSGRSESEERFGTRLIFRFK